MSAQKKKSDQDLAQKVLECERDDLKIQVEALQAQLIKIQPEYEKMKELAARAQADLQNARDRLRRDAEDMRRFASESFILSLLPTVDNFHRAFQHLPLELKDHEWVRGLQAIESGLMKLLEQAGLSIIPSLGQRVDAHMHEVLQTGPGEKDVILEVMQEGFALHGKVIRIARVKAGNGEVTTVVVENHGGESNQ